MQKYVLIATKYQLVEVYRRTSPGWTYDAYGLDDEVELMSIDVRFSVAALYRNAGVAAVIDGSKGEV